MRDIFGFDHGRDEYGFEKRAWGDLDNAAYFHGFNGPSYSDDPGTPVNMSLIDPSKGSRVGHGIGGGVLGGLGGAGLGMAAGAAFGGSGVGAAVGGLGGAILGGLHGYHNAPKELILRHGAQPGAPAPAGPVEPPKTASHDVFGFAVKEALAAPGLLSRMGGALRGMGNAAMSAGREGLKDYRMLRPTETAASSAATGLRSVGHSLMATQDGRRAAGVGLGLGAAGAHALGLAAGNAAYNATQPKPPVSLPR